MPVRVRALSLLLLLPLAACRVSSDGVSVGNGPVQRGTLLSTPPALTGTYTAADLASLLGSNSVGKELLVLAYAPVCSINVFQLKYETVGGRGEAATASGALMVPIGTDPACQGARPIVEYAHGTTPDKTYNLAVLGSSSTEALLLAAVFASRGYVVVAPNYAGYDSSDLPYHPYLNADQQSKDMIDALAAARTALSIVGLAVSDNHKLFITGYSQGGFVAMATQKAMQASGTTVTAGAHMSGPYALAAFGDAIFMGEVNASAALNFTLLAESYQNSYQNVYSNPTDVFEPAFAGDVGSLLPSTVPITTLYSEGKLPENALFPSTPPAPEFASITPAKTPAKLAPVFALGFGSPDLVTNNYRLEYLRDAQAAPDGGFPTLSTGVPASAPGNTLRQDLKTNDLRSWTPSSPVLLCAGDGDPTAFYLNTQLMQQYWMAHPPVGAVTVLDVDAAISSGDPYATLKQAFQSEKAAIAAAAVLGGATDGGAMAVLKAYHGELVPPVCLSAVKSFFDGY
ncbi:MAG: prolyl oligopeptidase family serine peptidase [Sinobacteraceae bacterium]|nr:prolyl oligopeptidase family serine peptidase [Nevskiaceae bacterium]